MISIEALELALAKEMASIKLYKRYAIDYPTVRDTFLFLQDEEQKHQRLIEKKIRELSE